MSVAVFEARQDGTSVQIDHASRGPDGFANFRERADREEVVVAYCDGLDGRVTVPHGDDVAVVIDDVLSGLLSGQRQGKSNQKPD